MRFIVILCNTITKEIIIEKKKKFSAQQQRIQQQYVLYLQRWLILQWKL